MTLQRLSELLKCELSVLHYLSQGQIGDIYQAKLKEQPVVIKTTGEDREDLLIEAGMLEDLSNNRLRVPQVFVSTKEALVMEYVKPCRNINYDKETEAAKALASLHQVSNESRMYGYYYNTTLASFHQNNEQTQYNWGLFLSQMRILPMARNCYDRGVLDKSLLDRLETLCNSIYKRIDMSRITPSLLHGDVWRGNVLYEKPILISLLRGL
ncbi:MAG: fructosamine kinase family protein [Sulfurovum sp.]